VLTVLVIIAVVVVVVQTEVATFPKSGEFLHYLVFFQDNKKFVVFYGTPTC
jgi:hypothetical protein